MAGISDFVKDPAVKTGINHSLDCLGYNSKTSSNERLFHYL